MVQMDFVDTYENVTLDTISCLKFARHIEFGGDQFEPDFLIVGDDDTYIKYQIYWHFYMKKTQ